MPAGAPPSGSVTASVAITSDMRSNKRTRQDADSTIRLESLSSRRQTGTHALLRLDFNERVYEAETAPYVSEGEK